MITRNLKEIESMCNGTELKDKYNDIVIKGVCTDSRNITHDQLFIPLIGENFNGHDFITMAIGKGAAACLWNKNEIMPDLDFPFILVDDTTKALQELAKSYRSQLNTKVVGITGSNGKTSTKDILASLLKTQYKTHKTLGNFNNYIGLPLTILSMDEDTEMAVLEMGMDNFGQIELLTSIARPDAAVITNIGEAHLEDLKTRENIAKAKLEILKGLKPNDFFLYYGDESLLKKEMNTISIDYNVKTFGKDSSNDYQPEILFVNETGDTFYLKEPESPEFFIPMLGEHQVLNATAAIAIARYFGISYENIRQGLLNIEKTGMRNELVHGKDFTILNDSYKSNPSSVLVALNTMYFMKDYDQKIVVLGDMQGLGHGEINMHKEIGLKIDSNEIDYVFTYGPLSQNIAESAVLNFGKDRVYSFKSLDHKDKLIRKIKEVMKPNSLILTKASRALAMEEVVESLIGS
ncbi:UDP-N-acetylmuramoyl-tripeptide--D-alanyl-D-alanine ligase [Tissierella sp. MB52-C2]|uniref:UDP-N-acetylmuramoyl-tripeptide--D-alanyl-D- alanine ligase n=1 Tax=Tissierella sp. MB52-C2 TaxID=3070999 RepID=UPI00280B4430|nr:UDP-N-acetylmuramoyl-tripeptide--D-alanyl-D-alanine ligase [Tissierella sp. MB52-C2]WMM25030.1 UDP-N-acetylmuramoyl-tripeptide--D-alanyl-D-alanine ligase [Tissierella sp. MB52-C2]